MTAATCPTSPPSSPTTTRAARSSSRRRCATTPSSARSSAATPARSSSRAATPFRVIPQKLDSQPGPSGPEPGRGRRAGQGRLRQPAATRDTRALWDHFIECLRSRNPETLCPAETGYAAIATVNLGVDSYRYGKAYFFDKATGKVSDADESWAKKWEKVSHERGKPQQVMGWKADPLEGSTLVPPGYQKLEGDWVNGQDPAAKA